MSAERETQTHAAVAGAATKLPQHVAELRVDLVVPGEYRVVRLLAQYFTGGGQFRHGAPRLSPPYLNWSPAIVTTGRIAC